MECDRATLPHWSWCAVLVVGFGLFELLRRALLASSNPHLVPALIFVGATVVPTAFVVFIFGRPVSFDVSGGALATIAAAGGVVGIVVAGTLEYDTLRYLGLFSMLGVALIEETAKLIVPALVLLLMRRYQLPADGLLLGVASGAGFAVLETMGYAFVALINSNGHVSAVDGVLALRGVLSPAGHMAWSGLAAAALGVAVVEHWSRAATTRLALASGSAVALHTAWDSVGTLPGYLVIAALGLGSLTVVSHRLRVRPAGSATGVSVTA